MSDTVSASRPDRRTVPARSPVTAPVGTPPGLDTPATPSVVQARGHVGEEAHGLLGGEQLSFADRVARHHRRVVGVAHQVEVRTGVGATEHDALHLMHTTWDDGVPREIPHEHLSGLPTPLRPGVAERSLKPAFHHEVTRFGINHPAMEGTFCSTRDGLRRLPAGRPIGAGEPVDRPLVAGDVLELQGWVDGVLGQEVVLVTDDGCRRLTRLSHGPLDGD